METIKVLMDPQPKVRKIDCGWEINGANYFMGFAETHIRKDDRFKPPAENYKDFWIHKDSDGRYHWVFQPKDGFSVKEVQTLDAVRKEWERKLDPILTVTKQTGSYSVVYVVLVSSHGDKYNMHRYFPIIDEWTVSVDKQNASLQECLAAVSEAFRKFYPNGH